MITTAIMRTMAQRVRSNGELTGKTDRSLIFCKGDKTNEIKTEEYRLW